MDNMYWWSDESVKNNRTYKIILCACILYLVIVPISSLKNMDFMKYNSYIAISCEIIVMLVVIAFYFVYDLPK